MKNWYGIIGNGKKSPNGVVGLWGKVCFLFSVRFLGEWEGDSGSETRTSTARPGAGFEWAEARLDSSTAAGWPKLGVRLKAIAEITVC